jgi:hypothetical protein
MSERRSDYHKVAVDVNIELALHQSELFGPRYQFYLTLDKLHTNTFSVEQARKLHAAFGELLALVEDEGEKAPNDTAARRTEGAKVGWEIRKAKQAKKEVTHE